MSATTSNSKGHLTEVNFWNDKRCEQLANKHRFPLEVCNINVQKRIISRFYNFYLGGKREKGIGVTDIVFSVLSIFPCSPENETSIWSNVFRDEQQYVENSTFFFLSYEDRLAAAGLKNDVASEPASESVKRVDNCNVSQDLIEIHSESGNGQLKSETIVNIIETSYHTSSGFTELNEGFFNPTSDTSNIEARETDNVGVDGQNYSIDESGEESIDDDPDFSEQSDSVECNYDFPNIIKWYTDVLSRPSKSEARVYGALENAAFIASVDALLDKWETDASARSTLKYFFGIVSLVLMRATAKGYKHLQNMFSSSKMFHILSYMGSIAYSVPHMRCLKASFKTFMKRDKNLDVMFAKLVSLYIKLDTKHVLQLAIRNSLLLYTADYGLKLVSMWRTIFACVGLTEAKFIKRLCTTKETARSWMEIRKFMSTYENELTFHWGHIMDSRSFRHLSCSRNVELGVYFAVFFEKLRGNTDIWQSKWLQNLDSDELDAAKSRGLKIYEKFKTLLLCS